MLARRDVIESNPVILPTASENSVLRKNDLENKRNVKNTSPELHYSLKTLDERDL